MSIRKIVNLVVVAALVPMAAQAEPLTYNVNRTIGAGTVFGTITTDGTFGSLTNANINAWSLTLDSSVSSPTLLTQANSKVLAAGSAALSAAIDSIDFNFDFNGVAFFGFQALFQSADTPLDTWCVQTGNCFTFPGSPGEFVGRVSFSSVGDLIANGDRVTDLSGKQQIATRAVSPVPEPATLFLSALALMGLAATRRRH